MSSRRYVAKTTLVASSAAMTSVPVLIAVQALTSDVHWPEVLGGAVFGVAFFAITPLVGVLLPDRDLKAGLLMTYLFKFSMCAAALLLVPTEGIDVRSAGLAVVAASVVYLTVSTLLLARRRSTA